jgi:hypothetical protein
MLDNSIVSKEEVEVKDNFFSDGDIEILTKDPASFALTFLITSKEERPISELYKSVPVALHDLLDSMIAHLASTGAVKIKDSVIHVLKRHFDENNNGRLSMFLPKIFELAANRILERDLQVVKNSREGIRYLVVPSNPEIADEIRAVTTEYVAKLNLIRQKSQAPGVQSDGHRMVGLFHYKMNVEDFV